MKNPKKYLKYAGIAFVVILLLFGFCSSGLYYALSHPSSPIYLDFDSPDPLYPASEEIYVIEENKLVSGMERYQIEYIPLTRMSDHVTETFIAVEDNRFYSHSGIDIKGILRAAFINMSYREIQQGGSTITQQLASTIFLDRTKSLDRKILEMGIARQLEDRYEKHEILEMYLNQIYFGGGHYGIYQASIGYFDKEPADLTLGEAALLAGIVPAPSVYSPQANPELALERQKIVLIRMVELGFITEEEAEQASFQGEDDIVSLKAYFCDREIGLIN